MKINLIQTKVFDMKKIVFVLCLLAAVGAKAQYDTLPYNIGRPYYYMQHSFDSMHVVIRNFSYYIVPMTVSLKLQILQNNPTGVTPLTTNTSPNRPYADSGDLAYGFYPDSTINIIGVAWFNALWPSFDDSSMLMWDTIDVKLYKPTVGNHMTPIARKKIAHNTFDYDKILDCARGWAESDISTWSIVYPTAPFYEVYFDQGISLSDSFYISVKYTWNSKSIYNLDVIGGWSDLHTINDATNPEVHIYPSLRYGVRDSIDFDAPWTYGEINAYPLLFPIIRRDCDSCPEVHELRYTKVGNSAAIVQWDAGANHSDWQLCYGTPGFDPDGAEATTIRVPQRALTGLSATAHYDVYVKARCQFDRSEYSPWAGPFDLCLAEIGIDGADAVEAEIGPNPADGMLTVHCEAEIKAVELYDMQGRCVASGEVGTASGEPRMATLRVQHLPAGTYTAVVRTAQGTATKQVVVL